MLLTAHALARWLLAVLGALALVAGVVLGARGAVADGDDGPAVLSATVSAEGLEPPVGAEEAPEERDEDGRDEEDPTDPEEIALHRVASSVLRPGAGGDTSPSHARRAARGRARAAHRVALERPPHA